MSTTAGIVGTVLVTGATHGIGGGRRHIHGIGLGDARLDIAPAVLFLATDDARYITGQTVGVDGGSFYTPDQASPESNASIRQQQKTARQRKD
jgi:Enoyl-(Acyl carrier protein) reductase